MSTLVALKAGSAMRSSAEESAQRELLGQRRKVKNPFALVVYLVFHYAAHLARACPLKHCFLRAWLAGRVPSELVLAPGRTRDVQEEEATLLVVDTDRAGSKGWQTLSFDLGCERTRNEQVGPQQYHT